MPLNPLTQKKIQRFRSIKRGFYSFVIFLVLLLLSLVSELWINKRALFVNYNGKVYFPTYSDVIPGSKLGFDYDYETNYRELKQREADNEDSIVIMPIIPWGPYESDFVDGEYPPSPPNFEREHYLGTDTAGRDVLARLIYGFRTAIWFSLAVLLVSYSIGITVGSLMGYFGGWFDLFVQRLIEIWSNLPRLYIIMILASLIEPSFGILVFVMVIFSWMSMTWYLRTETYREKAREYVLAARSMGASTARVIFQHTLPNSLAVIVTFIPFAVSGGISAIVSLDFLGFGLPAPTPSWGELLNQGYYNLDATWILTSVVVGMVIVLTLVQFVGEAVREAFDPKKHTTYE